MLLQLSLRLQGHRLRRAGSSAQAEVQARDAGAPPQYARARAGNHARSWRSAGRTPPPGWAACRALPGGGPRGAAPPPGRHARNSRRAVPAATHHRRPHSRQLTGGVLPAPGILSPRKDHGPFAPGPLTASRTPVTRPDAVPHRQRDRLRAQLLAMGGLRRRRPARSTAVWQVRSLVCGDRVTVVCGWLAGNAQRRRQQGQPWSPPNALDANRASLHPRWPAVWHRDVPLSHLPRGAGILLAAGTALAPWPDCFPLGGSRK